MANPLASFALPDAERPAETVGPTASEVASLLAGVSQETTNALIAAWDAATTEHGATMGEAMWALAMLQARVLASAEMGDEQVWVAGRFAELVQLALPAMMMAVERAKRLGGERPPNDA